LVRRHFLLARSPERQHFAALTVRKDCGDQGAGIAVVGRCAYARFLPINPAMTGRSLKAPAQKSKGSALRGE
jgi:hypothetical protein